MTHEHALQHNKLLEEVAYLEAMQRKHSRWKNAVKTLFRLPPNTLASFVS
jgi:hypothetical protein